MLSNLARSSARPMHKKQPRLTSTKLAHSGQPLRKLDGSTQITLTLTTKLSHTNDAGSQVSGCNRHYIFLSLLSARASLVVSIESPLRYTYEDFGWRRRNLHWSLNLRHSFTHFYDMTRTLPRLPFLSLVIAVWTLLISAYMWQRQIEFAIRFIGVWFYCSELSRSLLIPPYTQHCNGIAVRIGLGGDTHIASLAKRQICSSSSMTILRNTFPLCQYLM